MSGNCLTNCFTSRFKSRRPPILFDETLSNTTSNLRAADELDAAQPPSPALETPSTGPVVQHAEEGTELPHFEPAPQPPTPPLPSVPSVPPAHPKSPVPEIVPAGNLVPHLDGAGEYNGDGPTPLSAITERSEPIPSAGREVSIRGGYLPSTDELAPPSESDVEEDKSTNPSAPSTPPLPPAPRVPGLLYSLGIYFELRSDQVEGVGEGRTGFYYKEALEVELLLPDFTRVPQPQTV